MSAAPTAPGPSSAELKTRVANVMRRADAILSHPPADHTPAIQVAFALDRDGNPTGVTMDHQNVDVQALVYLAVLMRPIIFLVAPSSPPC